MHQTQRALARPAWLRWPRRFPLFGRRPLWSNRTPAKDRGELSVDPVHFIRAHPSLVVVEERARFEQEISRNPTVRSSGKRTGSIRLRLPYDGDLYVGPDAIRDAGAVLPEQGGPDCDAMIGHLLFVGHEETDLSDILQLGGRFGAYPLRVPIRSRRMPSLKSLAADTGEYQWEVDYVATPDVQAVIPLKVKVELFDPGHGDHNFTFEELERITRHDDIRAKVADAIKETGSFRPYLMLAITVGLVLPSRIGKPLDPPVVRSVSLRLLNEITLPASSVLLSGANDDLQADVRTSRFDWTGLPMTPVGVTKDGPRHFETKPMLLTVHHPGELFREGEVEVDVEVEIPGELLSGMQIRLFDARGLRFSDAQHGPLHVRSKVAMHSVISMRDAFAKRFVTPFQAFTFDEVIPDDLRIADVRASLIDQRFELDLDAPLPVDGKRRIRYLFIASRSDGPQVMKLVVYIEGERHSTRRQSRQPAGHRYTTKFESGSLHIYVRGVTVGDTRRINAEIGTLHLGLRDRFRKLKAHR